MKLEPQKNRDDEFNGHFKCPESQLGCWISDPQLCHQDTWLIGPLHPSKWEDFRPAGVNECPTHVKGIIHHYSPNGIETFLELEQLHHVRTVHGEVRYCSPEDKAAGHNGVDFTSHHYSLFLLGKTRVVIAVSHGGGIYFHELRSRMLYKTFVSMSAKLDDGEFFDFLNMIVEAYGHGLEHGTSTTSKKYAKAFIEGRLKKRRKAGKIRVEIDNVMEPKIKVQML